MSSLSSEGVSEEPRIHPAGLAASLPTGGKVVPLSSASAISDSIAAVLKSNMWVLPLFVARDSLRRESFSYGEPKAFSNFSVELWLLLPFCCHTPWYPRSCMHCGELQRQNTACCFAPWDSVL